MATIDTSLFPSANLRFQMAPMPEPTDPLIQEQRRLANETAQQNLEKSKREANKAKLTDAMRDVITHETPEDALASIDRHVADGTLTAEQAADAKSKVPVRGADGSLPQGAMATWRQRNFDDYLASNEQLYARQQTKEQQQQLKDIMGGGQQPTPAAVTSAPTNALAPVDQEQALFNQLNPSQQPAGNNALAPAPTAMATPDANAVDKQILALYALGTPQAVNTANFLKSQLEAQNKIVEPKWDERSNNQYKWYVDMTPGSQNFGKEVPGTRIKMQTTPGQAQTAAEKAVDDTGITKAERNKREAAFPKANAAFDSSNTEIDSLAADLTALANHPGLSSITGARAGTELAKGATTLVSQDAADAQALLDKIKSKGTLRALVDLRNSSPTGGALGNVSDADVRLLTNSFGNLSTKQATPTFKNSLDDIISQLFITKTRLKNAYDETYSYRSQTPPAGGAAQTPPASGWGKATVVTGGK